MQDIRVLGREKGLRFGVGVSKVGAIRAIQRAEGNFDCFGRAGSGYCDQGDCLFRAACLAMSLEPVPTRKKKKKPGKQPVEETVSE
ncbi:MAG: hypothetical protein ACQEUB_07285 [Thermodesulfobacteriota bacterium]